MANEVSDQDMVNYYRWQKDPSKENFQTLYRDMLPLINMASRKASYNSRIPQSVFKLEAAQQFYNALHRFDPAQGNKLSTFVKPTIENKLKRINYKYQNISRITERGLGEGGITDITNLNNSVAILKDRLNRDPTDVEISQEMGVTPDKITRLRGELRKDLSLNADLEDLATTGEEDIQKSREAMLYYDLGPEAQLVYDCARGAHGKNAITKPNGKPDWGAIGNRLNMSETKVQRLRTQIATQMSLYWD